MIKDSYGGMLGNDKEALAQSAFEAIADKATYEKVKSILGEDPYEFVKDFMDTDEDYHNNGKTIDGEYKRLFGGGEDKNVITGDYLIPVAWPEYEPEITDGDEWTKQIQSVLGQAIFGHDSEKYDSTDKITAGKAGHGGIGIVESNGKVRLFEFGRYAGHGKGMGLTKIANIPVRAKFNKNKELINADEIAKSMKQNSQW